ncbi:uncharacterized protein STEHIDRAFT_151067 [Stereum hirsutum FP-91666 SS1]|uniref:DDE Tnp4 domain-containing protein n=1 Tax=Stereum hirsutum (strain FP-91666) TaxID=721885 RepID=R7RVH3_STEHR|nr:uncharacterized protein STEHIDRAFT_144584 [Stereum hirsutum FP-91666 SS1]XP_007311897.1 uncharacterized protein STEHIDRAFT_151067 [Stereum hirsutum FP-91666 SS1]EIM79004.1 hypothetical protein STEHIDRAFT_151067 [Stereum hirsutum FP-91666 SS1]EIM91208.1 hypothetical protein STEHIDRAFT_144584 [Stereum hirsutum FP-91666 SS1]
MGRYGNGSSITDVARMSGYSEGAVELFTDRCLDALMSLHDILYIEEKLGFEGSSWREGWIMYDGTIIVLYARPGLDGASYYTRKCNYGLNCQIGNCPSNLRIGDYSCGNTGATHDSTAFDETCAGADPDWLFSGREFAWGDSAYTVNARTIPVHKRPAAFDPSNALFDKFVSRLCVRSEHCMGALKGRWQSLRGLRIPIRTKADHLRACNWVSCCILMHNAVLDIDGWVAGVEFLPAHGRAQEAEDRGERDDPLDICQYDGYTKQMVRYYIPSAGSAGEVARARSRSISPSSQSGETAL